MNELIVHKVDITHYRLVELSKLADQAKPFYEWVEKTAKKITGSHQELNEILMSATKADIKSIINACYLEPEEKCPFLFDGIGRVYPHTKACFYFFAWMIRDAPQQRLKPLIARMKKQETLDRSVAEIDTLVELIFEYRSCVRSFNWLTVREVIIDRLEGSRRSIKGHHLEANVRTALITAFQHYFSIQGNYGKYQKVSIANKQIKIGNHTVDVSATLIPKTGTQKETLLLPIKTRETEGGGHSHLFTRDIVAAVQKLKEDEPNYHIIAVIIAQNWSISELSNIRDRLDRVFYFALNPNKFFGFDNASQIELNKYIQAILNG
jgi:hypothetical protein